MYESKLKGAQMDALFDAILQLKDREECYRFFDDLCTVSEMLAMSQRFEVAQMLDGGRTYQAIAGETGASTATISRVNRCLLFGADGYRLVLDRLKTSGEEA